MAVSKNIEKKVFQLNKKDRTELLLKLLDSLEPEIVTEDTDTHTAWVKEADRRYRAWKRGEMKTMTEEEVLKRLNKKS
ncbi:MAG: addiction module protein [Balneolaceae bacterium]|nr:addiction module protein [Balneolaceae bacterium]